MFTEVPAYIKEIVDGEAKNEEVDFTCLVSGVILLGSGLTFFWMPARISASGRAFVTTRTQHLGGNHEVPHMQQPTRIEARLQRHGVLVTR